MSKLRFYQREAIRDVTKAWERESRVLCNTPTGSGKTVIASCLIEQILRTNPESKILFLADQDELCKQPQRAIARWSKDAILSVEKSSQIGNFTADVIVGSVQTLSKKERLERYPEDHFTHIIQDEAHRNVKPRERIMSHFWTSNICALTATPFRATMKDLSKWYPEVAYSLPMDEFIDLGFAPTRKVLTLPLELDVENVGMSFGSEGKDYKVSDIATTIEPYFDKIAEMIKEYAPNRHGIAYLPLVRSSIAFMQVLKRHGIPAAHVDSSSSDRDDILRAFEEGKFLWLCNSNLVSTGVDIPIADCMLNLTLTRSMSTYQQREGRVMRPLPGVIDDYTERNEAEIRKKLIAESAKPNFLVLDLLWQHDKMGHIRPADVICQNAEMAAKVQERMRAGTEEDILEIQKRVQAEREAALAEALEKNAARAEAKKPLDYATTAFFIGYPKMATYEPVSQWEFEPPTQPQLALLADKGIDPATVPTKGHAKQMIDAIMVRGKCGYATVLQVKALHRMYGDTLKNIELLSRDEAARLIDQKFQERKARRMSKV